MLGLLGLTTAVGAAGWLASSLLAVQVGWFLDDWSSRNGPAPVQAYDHARDQAERALRWGVVPTAADWTRLALVHEWRASQQPAGPGTWPAELAQALAAHQAAAAARPDWHLGWARLASFKARHNQIDDTFLHALSETLRAGPTRIEGLRIVARLGAIHYAALPDTLQADVITAAARTLGYSGNEARQLAPVLRDAQLLDAVCAELATNTASNALPAVCR